MIVLVGSVGGQLGADIIGHVGPDFSDSGRKGPPGFWRGKRLPKKLPGALLGRQAFGTGLSVEQCNFLFRQIYDQRHKHHLIPS